MKKIIQATIYLLAFIITGALQASGLTTVEAVLADPIAGKIAALGELSRESATKQYADKFNLCDIKVPGTKLFCQANKGIPRYLMPQLSGQPMPGSFADRYLPKDKKGEVDATQAFVNYLIGKAPVAGMQVIPNLSGKPYLIFCPQKIKADDLNATQSDLIGSKVAGMWLALSQNKNWQKDQLAQCGPALQNCNADIIPPADTSNTKGITAPIFVSADNYILDGHHRWAAIVAASRYEPTVSMCARKVNAPIDQLLKEADNFTAKFGLPNEAGTLPVAK
jgi:hypothetical protein